MIGCVKYQSTIEGGFTGFDPSEFNELFKDGRVFSHFSESYLRKLFPDLHKPKNKCSKGFDYYLNGGKVEVKTLTKDGFTTVPSYMIGKSRIYNEDEHREIFNGNAAYIIIDNTNFPAIETYYIIRNDRLFFKNKLSFKKAKELLNDLTSDSPVSIKNFG